MSETAALLVAGAAAMAWGIAANTKKEAVAASGAAAITWSTVAIVGRLAADGSGGAAKLLGITPVGLVTATEVSRFAAGLTDRSIAKRIFAAYELVFAAHF